MEHSPFPVGPAHPSPGQMQREPGAALYLTELAFVNVFSWKREWRGMLLSARRRELSRLIYHIFTLFSQSTDPAAALWKAD